MSSADRLQQAIDRTADVNPQIAAVCTPSPDALDDARRRDTEEPRSALHGIPVLVKDNIDTAGLPTTAGSLALADVPPPSRDATLVRRLRDAGMVLLGKTNLSEWANFRDGNSVSGWSAYGGLTRNPYALNRSAGGSSSGSGAAVAAGITPFAIGSETDGSITCPAAFNGCVGLKPTVGLVPRDGIIPISHSQDSPGPLTATVAQSAALLAVLTGQAYDAAVGQERLRGVRIGVPRKTFWGYSDHADGPAERALQLLSEAGATIVDNADLPAELGWQDELLVMLAEFRAGLADYLRTRSGDGPRTLADIVQFNKAHAAEELPHFGQSLLEEALVAPDLNDRRYLDALERCRAQSRGGGIDAVLREHDLTALVSPACPPAFLIDHVNPEHTAGACSTPAAQAGYPLLTVPSGVAAGLPVAVTFWGTAHSEQSLLRIAAAYEAARDGDTGPLPAPAFVPFV
ncbi:amidase family protein [Rudaeicoccus suwonensis]|uniref:amidase family protein n=1 Tax=Rudaeicoccus suwonensis TaxID=657409 RepID=UPI001BAA02DC|nr:amidase family protein [Rudaeicoccus suwonensis]